MSHEIETFRNGDAAFYSARVPAWHRLGTVVPQAVGIEEALRIAHLDRWDIQLQPMVTLDHDGNAIPVPGKYATVRRNPEARWDDTAPVSDVLGSDLSEKYEVVQNEQAAEFLAGVVGDGEAVLETAGSLYGGRRVFLTLRLPESVTIVDGDDLDLYCAVAFGHDGSFAFHAFPTPTRVVCKNTLNVAMSEADKHTYRVLHMNGALPKIAEAREALRITFSQGDAIAVAARAMLDQAVTDAEFDALVAANFVLTNDDMTPRVLEAREQSRSDLRRLFRDAPTQEIGRGTAWGAYNALAEYAEFVKVADSRSEAATMSTIMGKGLAWRQKAWDLLTV